MWIPMEFWDEEDKKRGHKSEDVRGEKELELEVEYDEVEAEGEGHGLRYVVGGVWRKLEKTGSRMQRTWQHMERTKELDNGHDGDL